MKSGQTTLFQHSKHHFFEVPRRGIAPSQTSKMAPVNGLPLPLRDAGNRPEENEDNEGGVGMASLALFASSKAVPASVRATGAIRGELDFHFSSASVTMTSAIFGLDTIALNQTNSDLIEPYRAKIAENFMLREDRERLISILDPSRSACSIPATLRMKSKS